MIFFTDITTNISNYCMLNVKKYNDKRKLNKKIVFIDPSVYELKNSAEYSMLPLLHILANSKLPKNEFISIDYPCDMNQYYEGTFIEKSYYNNVNYATNNQYICTIQCKFGNFNSFVYQSERLRDIWEIEKKIIGIGSLCCILHTNLFTDKVYQYIADNFQNKKVHIYGMPLRHIRKYIRLLDRNDIQLSADSTKWTKRIHKNPPLDLQICCRKNTRDIYFLEYMKEIAKETPVILY